MMLRTLTAGEVAAGLGGAGTGRAEQRSSAHERCVFCTAVVFLLPAATDVAARPLLLSP
jgi:hypothetical protein